MDFGNTTTSIWSKIKGYIDSKLSSMGGGDCIYKHTWNIGC